MVKAWGRSLRVGRSSSHVNHREAQRYEAETAWEVREGRLEMVNAWEAGVVLKTRKKPDLGSLA